MKKLLPVFFAAIVLTLFSCQKEYSLENAGNNSGNGLIVGTDCRISKIAYNDTTAAAVSTGAITAAINNADNVTSITKFDSLSFTIEFYATPVYISDTVFINADEYFIVDATTRLINQLHGLVDPTDPFSAQFDPERRRASAFSDFFAALARSPASGLRPCPADLPRDALPFSLHVFPLQDS